MKLFKKDTLVPTGRKTKSVAETVAVTGNSSTNAIEAIEYNNARTGKKVWLETKHK